jgi:hypothetical protein
LTAKDIESAWGDYGSVDAQRFSRGRLTASYTVKEFGREVWWDVSPLLPPIAR